MNTNVSAFLEYTATAIRDLYNTYGVDCIEEDPRECATALLDAIAANDMETAAAWLYMFSNTEVNLMPLIMDITE